MGCSHYGYLIKDGQLVCSQCGNPSPKAKVVDNIIVPLKADGEPENKMEAQPEDKGVHWPTQTKWLKRKMKKK